MKGKPWSDDALAELRRRYPHEPTAALVADLGYSASAIYQKARTLGLHKTAEYLASPAACRLRRGDNIGEACRFQKGMVPWNKGSHFVAGGRSTETQFKPGRPASEAANYLSIGSLRVNADGYLERKTTDDPGIYPARRWVPVHRLVWIAAHGPLPADHICVFKAGLRTTVLEEITPDRLECITRVENMRRNSYHNRYPKEIGLAIQARGALIRKINRATRDNQTPKETTT